MFFHTIILQKKKKSKTTIRRKYVDLSFILAPESGSEFTGMLAEGMNQQIMELVGIFSSQQRHTDFDTKKKMVLVGCSFQNLYVSPVIGSLT